MKRRDFLQHGIAAATLIGMSPKLLFASADTAGNAVVTPLSISHSNNRVMICQGDRVLTEYGTSPMQKSPCFTYMAGPATGRSLISAIPQPWRQTTGLSFACDRISCDDTMMESHFGCGPRQLGQIVSRDLSLGICTETTAEFRNFCEWQRPGYRPIIADERCFRLSLISETAYTLDCEYTLTPLTNLTVRPSGQSFFSLRMADDLAVSGGGQQLHSLNTTSQLQTRVTTDDNANWLTYFNKRGDMVEGIAVIRPDNTAGVAPGSRWLTRDYGLLVPNSFHFRDTAWQLRKWETYHFAYRIVAYSGPPDTRMINRF